MLMLVPWEHKVYVMRKVIKLVVSVCSAHNLTYFCSDLIFPAAIKILWKDLADKCPL